MKSYTDLEQSKTLAEILPLESADFVWLIGHLHTDGPRYKVIRAKNEVSEPENYWPCWSLAALLSVLPAECECMSLEHINYGGNYKKYFMHYVGGENTEDYDNPIDACVEMIIKLNKLNLL